MSHKFRSCVVMSTTAALHLVVVHFVCPIGCLIARDRAAGYLFVTATMSTLPVA
jgi:hypothetical protein